MPESLLNEDGLIVEYYGAMCDEWTRENVLDDTHYRTECTITGSNKQLLEKNMADLTPDACPECDGEISEHYTVITWVPGERVTTEEALEVLEGTRGAMVLKFTRKNEPSSDFSEKYFPGKKPLYIHWKDDEMKALTTHHDSVHLTVTKSVLDELLSHYPVDAVTLEDTPFEFLRN